MLNKYFSIAGLILISFLLISCASQSKKINILERALGENLEYGGITFLAGPWHSLGTSYGYHLGETHLVIAQANDSTFETYVIKLSECVGLATSVNELKLAVFHTVEVFAGKKSKTESDVLIMDGPVYELVYYSNDISGPIILRGGGNSRNAVPWIDAAFKIDEVAHECLKGPI